MRRIRRRARFFGRGCALVRLRNSAVSVHITAGTPAFQKGAWSLCSTSGTNASSGMYGFTANNFGPRPDFDDA